MNFLIRSTVLFLIILTISGIVPAFAVTADLYEASVHSPDDAAALAAVGAEPVLRLVSGYLVLLEPQEKAALDARGVTTGLIVGNIDRDRLALDLRREAARTDEFQLVYEADGIRLLEVDPRLWSDASEPTGLAPLLTGNIAFEFKPPTRPLLSDRTKLVDLDSLVVRVREDSITSYAHRLEEFEYRVAGTQANRDARDWLVSKFVDFGYDSIYTDYFSAEIDGATRGCYNIVVTKTGTGSPAHHVIIGAHRDAVKYSPGADDNGSGTDAVLEIARALQGIETRMTIVFILFDAEEWGLYGSWDYANAAAARGDSIVVMLNMDMVGHIENTNQARIFTHGDSYIATVWDSLSENLETISLLTEIFVTKGSDQTPFFQNGYEAFQICEYVLSDHYHNYDDSTTYLNFDYLTRIARATLATGYLISETYPVAPLQFALPEAPPTMIYPNYPETASVIVEPYTGQVEPNSVALHYSINGEAWEMLPLAPMGGDLYQAVLPPFPCFARIEYYYAADEIVSGTWSYPNPATPFSALVATGIDTVFHDNGETDMGWTVSGTARRGHWERAAPTLQLWGAPGADFDGSGKCWLTEEGRLLGVDDGTTILTSRSIPTSSGETVISYARWYDNSTLMGLPNADTFRVFVRTNQTSMVLVEEIGPIEQSSGDWYTHEFCLSDYVTPADSMMLRFVAADMGDESQVEAAVDAVLVREYTCAPLILNEDLPDWTAGIPYFQTLRAVGCSSSFTWSDKNNSLAPTGLTLSSDGIVSGTVTTPVTLMFIAVAADTAADTGERYFNFIMNPYPAITATAVPPGQVGEPYICNLTSTGGTGEITWTDRDNDLAGTGLSVEASGCLSGTPLDSGNVLFVVQIEDEAGAVAEQQLTLRIDPSYICGDADNSGSTPNVADLTFIVAYLFQGGPEPPIYAAADADGSGDHSVSDLTYLVAFLFTGGQEPICEGS